MSKVEDIAAEKSLMTKTGNLGPEQLQEYSNLLKQLGQFYREENSQIEEIFRKLKLLNDELKLMGLGSSLPKFQKIIAHIETKSLSFEKVELGQAEKLRKHSNYVSKLKICIRHYVNLNENITKQIKFFKSELEHSRQNVNNMLKLFPQGIQQLEEKAKKYENELVKFEKKYPWLKEPNYDLPNIGKQIDNLKFLKDKKENLLKELSIYQNLKPDIKEAKQQLNELKEQVKTVMLNFKHNN